MPPCSGDQGDLSLLPQGPSGKCFYWIHSLLPHFKRQATVTGFADAYNNAQGGCFDLGCTILALVDTKVLWNMATGVCLAVVPNAHEAGDRRWITAACAVPGGAATGALGGSVRPGIPRSPDQRGA